MGSARLPEFKDEAVRARGLAQLNARGIDGLVVIGGNGTQTGALALSRSGLPWSAWPSTIDNDLAGSEMTIGVDTALTSRSRRSTGCGSPPRRTSARSWSR